MNVETCPVRLRGGSLLYPRVCGRPVKEDGLCGVHLEARARRDRNADARREERARMVEQSSLIAARLRRHGIESQVGWSGVLVGPAWESVADALDAQYGGGSS